MVLQFSLPNLPVFVYLSTSLMYVQVGLPSRALDIGCAVGRSTFELAREFDEVVGMDFSSAFIAKCQQLKISGESEYTLIVEGNIVEKKTAQVDPSIVRYCIYDCSM